MTKEQRKIKELTAQVANLTTQVADLTKQLEEAKSWGNRWYSNYSEIDKQLGELHTIFDLLSVPRKTSQQGYSSDISISNRMTLYVAGIRDIVKDKED